MIQNEVLDSGSLFQLLSDMSYLIIDRLYLAPLWRGGRGCVISPPYNHHNQSHLTITGSFAVCFS